MRSAARLTYEEVQAARDGSRRALRAARRKRLAALYGAFAALDRGARGARRAGARSRPSDRVVLDAERRPVAVVRARAARQPPADRGIHDPGQCRGRRGAGGAAAALHVPGARRARPGEARGAARFPRRDSAFPASRWPRGRSSGRSCSTACCAAPRGTGGSAARQRTRPALPGAGRLQPEQYRPFRSGAARATPISPRRSGAMPICWCIAR